MIYIDKDYKTYDNPGYIKLQGAKVSRNNFEKFGVYKLEDTDNHILPGVKYSWFVLHPMTKEKVYVNPGIFPYKLSANKALLEPQGAFLYEKSFELLKRKSLYYEEGGEYVIFLEKIDIADEEILTQLQDNYPTSFKIENINDYE